MGAVLEMSAGGNGGGNGEQEWDEPCTKQLHIDETSILSVDTVQVGI